MRTCVLRRASRVFRGLTYMPVRITYGFTQYMHYARDIKLNRLIRVYLRLVSKIKRERKKKNEVEEKK